MAFRDGKKSCVLCGDTSPGGGGGGSGDYNTDVQIDGVADGVNDTFTLLTEYFAYDPAQPVGPQVYINGLRQTLGIHYTVEEGGGVGTGYNRIVFIAACIPQVDDLVIVDYFEEVTP